MTKKRRTVSLVCPNETAQKKSHSADRERSGLGRITLANRRAGGQ